MRAGVTPANQRTSSPSNEAHGAETLRHFNELLLSTRKCDGADAQVKRNWAWLKKKKNRCTCLVRTSIIKVLLPAPWLNDEWTLIKVTRWPFTFTPQLTSSGNPRGVQYLICLVTNIYFCLLSLCLLAILNHIIRFFFFKTHVSVTLWNRCHVGGGDSFTLRTLHVSHRWKPVKT